MSLNVKVFVANNEGLPWTEDDIGYPTYQMETKAVSGIRQTGDYFATHNDSVIPILVERKSLQDFYGSTIPEKNRARLYKEIERYHEDDRFNEFIIIVEATRKMFMAFFPAAMWINRKSKTERSKFIRSINKKKVTVLQHLEDRGAEIIFADNRQHAASVFGTIVTEYITSHKL